MHSAVLARPTLYVTLLSGLSNFPQNEKQRDLFTGLKFSVCYAAFPGNQKHPLMSPTFHLSDDIVE